MSRRKNVRWAIDMMECGGDEVLGIRPHHPQDVFNRDKMLKLYKEAKGTFPDKNIWFVGIDNDWNMKSIYYHDGCGRKRRN